MMLDHSTTIEIAGESTEPSEVAIPLSVAPGMHVTAMTVTVGGRRLQAARAVAWSAVSPTRLEAVDADRGALVLHVGGVTQRQHAFVRLTVERDGADWMTADLHPGVDAAISLVIATPAVVAPTITIGQPTLTVQCTFGGRPIRRTVKLHLAALTSCYEHELLHDHKLEGRVDMHFSIASDGAVADVIVDGLLASDAVKRCVAAEAATWTFAVDDAPSRVNYPLTFVRTR